MAGFRLHSKKDADIIADLNRFSNKSDRIKECYRMAMNMERSVLRTEVKPSVASSVQQPVLHNDKPTVQHTQDEVARTAEYSVEQEVTPNVEHSESLTWELPKEPTVRDVNPNVVIKTSRETAEEHKTDVKKVKNKFLKNGF